MEKRLWTLRYNKGRDKISLVILDLIMPEMGGRQCLERLLMIDTNLKIIVASGYSADGPTKESMSIGAKGFIVKTLRHSTSP